MNYLKRAWHYLLGAPFTWIFKCFFQPTTFNQESYEEALSKRIIQMLRLFLPMFFVAYMVALALRFGIYKFSGISIPGVITFLLVPAWATFLGILLGETLGVIREFRAEHVVFGITLGIVWGGLTERIIWDNGWIIVLGIGGSILGYVCGNIIGDSKANAVKEFLDRVSRNGNESLLRDIASAFVQSPIKIVIKGMVWGFIWGTVWGIVISCLMNSYEAIGISVVGSIAFGIAVATLFWLEIGSSSPPTRFWTFGIRICTFGIGMGISYGIIYGIGSYISYWIALSSSIGIILVVLLFFLGMGFYAVGLLVGSFLWGLIFGYSIFFIVVGTSYITVKRWLIYPISAISGLRMYLASQKKPSQVFVYLHRSSLYWDECSPQSILGLKETLLIAVDQDVERALQEIAFIATARPHQIEAARSVSLEIAIRDLESRDDLRDIAQVTKRLSVILPQGSRLINPRWNAFITRLNDISEDAARYLSPLGLKARRNALKDMVANMYRFNTSNYFKDAEIRERLNIIINNWRNAAQADLKKLEGSFVEIGEIDNPYTPGPPLKLHDKLFIGRNDLAQQLLDALNKGERHPTFFLNGERRMGKTSTLKQLPDMLGTRYLPIFFDLQRRGISSSCTAFLTTIANEIYFEMTSKEMQINKFEYEKLQVTNTRNEAAAYRVFDEWFTSVEHLLDQEECTIVLVFDEFEKLEEAGQSEYLDLKLLLDWFRSVIQNNPRLAVLFSGIRTFSELSAETGINWAGYFVNVQTLKVSYLKSEEARKLICQPIPDILNEQIFGEEVIEEIIRVTNCHPFLIQAICSSLIDKLNTENRGLAELRDVTIAMNQVLENWWDTYFQDLWERSDKDQRSCLTALKDASEGDLQTIIQWSGLSEKSAQQALGTLFRRDLVSCSNGSYRIASPIYHEWVERNS